MPRPRKPVGTRRIDMEKLIFLKLPNEIYEKLEQLGKPDKVALEIIKNNLPK